MLNSYQYANYVNEYDADERHGQAGLTYSPEALEHYRTGDDPVNYPSTDWQRIGLPKQNIVFLSQVVRTR